MPGISPVGEQRSEGPVYCGRTGARVKADAGLIQALNGILV